MGLLRGRITIKETGVILLKENLKVYEAIAEAKESGKRAAVATVIKVIGSSYRREGAKMFVDETERNIGLISGGCLESDVAEEAKAVIKSGKPFTKFYDLDEDYVWGLGLGCPGKVMVYIERVS
ncbi:XdhC and CoxI family protein [Lacicoccus alkaliphilus]|uniref:XdhC and CoxI family protein n=1 Tax=Lacicoccus alkaliphilus DSM 16010 TaxID=1123231 RepID=A0A1M7H418_9BACL|nr:XdhC and CoxI family protein [Salinicoccus alkaliphilus DSM 16010]